MQYAYVCYRFYQHCINDFAQILTNGFKVENQTLASQAARITPGIHVIPN